MGYYIFSYGIKTDDIKTAFNSKDPDLLAEVEQNDIFKNYSDFQPSDFETTPDKALEDIVNGNPFDEKSNYAYGYAVIGICSTLGTELPYTQEIKLGFETDLINKVLKEDFNISDFNIEETLLADNSHPFPIPKMDDWPLIGLLTRQQLTTLKGRLANINITDQQVEEFEDDPEEKGFAYEHLKGILENVDFCILNELDMISFCH